MTTYITVLKQFIYSHDIDPAKKYLSQIAEKSESEQQEILHILALAKDQTALMLLDFLTREPYHKLKIHDRIIQLVIDRAHLNYDFAIILMENLEFSNISHALPLIRHMLNKETRKIYLSKIISFSHTNRIEQLVPDIAEFIFYDDADLKKEAVQALEKIGTNACLEKLLEAADTSKRDQHILDAIESLKKQQSSKLTDDALQTKSRKPSPNKPVSQFEIDDLVSKNIQQRFDALAWFSEQGPDMVTQLFNKVKDMDLNQNHDLAINIIRLIARTTPMKTVNDLFDITNSSHVENTIRFAIYSALNAFPALESTAALIKGLSDPALYIRIAAAKTLDKKMTDFVGVEIKKLVESGTRKAETIAQTLLDANAFRAVEFLMISDSFDYVASNYLSTTTSLPVLDTYISVLEKRNQKASVKKYNNIRAERAAGLKAKIVNISSSDGILDTYSKMINTYGVETLSFKRSQDALETIATDKPKAIICDLILNNMTGLQLTRELREIYSKTDLPIIISTLQKDLSPSQLEKMAIDTGVNGIYRFPPKPSQVKSWVS